MNTLMMAVMILILIIGAALILIPAKILNEDRRQFLTMLLIGLCVAEFWIFCIYL